LLDLTETLLVGVGIEDRLLPIILFRGVPRCSVEFSNFTGAVEIPPTGETLLISEGTSDFFRGPGIEVFKEVGAEYSETATSATLLSCSAILPSGISSNDPCFLDLLAPLALCTSVTLFERVFVKPILSIDSAALLAVFERVILCSVCGILVTEEFDDALDEGFERGFATTIACCGSSVIKEALATSCNCAGLINIPNPSLHEKYRTPATDPSFFPALDSNSIPIQAPSANSVGPTKRTMASIYEDDISTLSPILYSCGRRSVEILEPLRDGTFSAELGSVDTLDARLVVIGISVFDPVKEVLLVPFLEACMIKANQ
jgi:hypothetical protein